MSLQWTLVAGFLYVEIAIIFLLCLEFISPTRWRKIFTSRIVSLIRTNASVSFYTILVILLLLFADSINQMWKYRKMHAERMEHGGPTINVGATDPSTQMFRAQRNFYIAGFALFLLLVLNRLVRLLSKFAVQTASHEAVRSQLKNSSDECERLMGEMDKLRKQLKTQNGGKTTTEDVETEKLQEQLRDAKEELASTKTKLEAMKAQAVSTSREYDRLLSEHSKLQKETGMSGDKKDD